MIKYRYVMSEQIRFNYDWHKGPESSFHYQQDQPLEYYLDLMQKRAKFYAEKDKHVTQYRATLHQFEGLTLLAKLCAVYGIAPSRQAFFITVSIDPEFDTEGTSLDIHFYNLRKITLTGRLTLETTAEMRDWNADEVEQWALNHLQNLSLERFCTVTGLKTGLAKDVSAARH